MPKNAHTSSSLGGLSILTVGFGLHTAWVCSTMFSTSTIFDTTYNLPGIHGSDFSIVYVISAIVFGVSLLFAAVSDQKLLKFYVSKKTLFLSALLASVGTLFLVLPIEYFPVALTLEIASGVATGLGSAILLLFWGTTFARHNTPTIVLNGALAFVSGLVFNALVLHNLPFPLGGLITVIIPLIEWAILSKVFPKPFAETNDAPYFKSLPTNKRELVLRLGAPILALGLALGILRQTSVQTSISSATTLEEIAMLLLSACTSVLIFIILSALQKSDQWDRFFREYIPVIAVATLVLSLIVSKDKNFSNSFLLISYMCFEVLMWTLFAHVAQRFRLSPILVFGLCRGMLALASLAGTAAPILLSPWSSYTSFGDNGLIIVALILMAIGFLLMPTVQKVESLVLQCPLARIISISREEDIDLLDMLKASANSTPGGASGDAGTSNAADSATEGAAQMQEEAVQDAAAEPLEASASESQAASTVKSHTSATESSDSKPHAAPGESPDLSPAPPQKTLAASMSAQGQKPGSGTDEKQEVGRFTRRVNTVAKTYLLTEREKDILFELAKGQSPTSIQEKYYISEGTVKTHIRHIYHKLNIHKRQDLMRLIEEADDNA